MDQVLTVLTNLPNQVAAERVAQELISCRAAACVNILAECRSIYRWQEKVESATEVPLLIKTTRAAYPRVEQVIRKLHPYALPEIIAIPVVAGLAGYLNWVAQETEVTAP